MIYPVLSEDVLGVWGFAAPKIEVVLDRFDTGFSLDDVLMRLLRQEMQLWLVDDRAACVTQICVYPQHKILLVLYLCGEGVDEWLDELRETLEAYGKHMECKYITLRGREGWVKKGKSRGYKPNYTEVRKEL